MIAYKHEGVFIGDERCNRGYSYLILKELHESIVDVSRWITEVENTSVRKKMKNTNPL